MAVRADFDVMIGIVRDEESSCVRRGEAIDQLHQDGMTLAKIAERAQLSLPAMSHLRKCHLNLTGLAREMCRSSKMNADACYLLASRKGVAQGRVMRHAIEESLRREGGDTIQRIGSRGRRTPKGKITHRNMEEAIRAVRYGADTV